MPAGKTVQGSKGYPLVKEFVAFIKERERIRIRKERGDKAPWTKDPFLSRYRFCNIHREDDRVSRWVSENIREPWKAEPDLWFAIVVCRLLNLPDSIEAVKDCLLPWKPKEFSKILLKRKAAGVNNFNAAYIVSTNGIAMDKVEYLVERVLNPLWAARTSLRPTVNDDLFGWHAKLMTYDGLGSFMAAQVVADMKYVMPLRRAHDWHTFAASGPGSRKGLNRVMGVFPEASWKRGAWEEALAGLATLVALPLRKAGIELHAQDLQNCLCEFDKYRRAVEGGEPKQLYKEAV